jgi:hypothetical protein
MKLFVKHCFFRHNIARAVKVALIVGTILGAINHFDMFLSGKFEVRRIVQIIVTYFVPFIVSLYSGAMYGRHTEIKDQK